ncbi:MAG: hypothetical protein I8H77_09475 [Comamonadaceae bacterium]|nr:hypothetical protein [Comamonadaceae bacterium]
MTTIHSNSHHPAATETLSKPLYQAKEGLQVALSEDTWDAVKKGSQDEGNFFSRMWDAIKEFFTPSDQVEAKHAFLDFYSEKSTDQEKLDGFYKLKELAGFGNQDLCSPEVRYQAKPDGGFFKVYDLKVKVEGVDTPLERQVSEDCNEAYEIAKAYSPSISSERDREYFADCIKSLYQSPGALAATARSEPLNLRGISLGLEYVSMRAPGLGVFFNENTLTLEFKDKQFPEHGSSAVDKSIGALQSSAVVKNDLKNKVESYRPAPLSYMQKNDAIQLLSQAMDASPKDYSKNDRKQVGKLLEIVYSRGATFQQKEAALLNLRNQIGNLPGMAFEVSHSTVSSFHREKGAVAEITNLRMSFSGNENSLKPVEIFNANVRGAAAGEKADSEPGLTYRPWTAIFAIGTGVQTPYLRPEFNNIPVGQSTDEATDEFFDLEPETIGSAATDAQQRLNAGNHSAEASVADSEDVFYDFDVVPETGKPGGNSSNV